MRLYRRDKVHAIIKFSSSNELSEFRQAYDQVPDRATIDGSPNTAFKIIHEVAIAPLAVVECQGVDTIGGVVSHQVR
jgi:hypothetical protein